MYKTPYCFCEHCTRSIFTVCLTFYYRNGLLVNLINIFTNGWWVLQEHAQDAKRSMVYFTTPLASVLLREYIVFHLCCWLLTLLWKVNKYTMSAIGQEVF